MQIKWILLTMERVLLSSQAAKRPILRNYDIIYYVNFSTCSVWQFVLNFVLNRRTPKHKNLINNYDAVYAEVLNRIKIIINLHNAEH